MGANLRVKNMNQHVGVIEHEPTAGGRPGIMLSMQPLFLQFGKDLVGNCLEVRLAGSGANDKKIRERRDFSKVEDDDVFGFFIQRDFATKLGDAKGRKGRLFSGHNDFVANAGKERGKQPLIQRFVLGRSIESSVLRAWELSHEGRL